MGADFTRQAEKGVDVVVLSSTGIVRALVSAGLSISHAQAAARLFMPHLQMEAKAELPAFNLTRTRHASGRNIARRRASAMLKMMEKELARLCDRAEAEEHVMHARRGSGLALLNMLKAEYQAKKTRSNGVHRLLLSADMRVLEADA